MSDTIAIPIVGENLIDRNSRQEPLASLQLVKAIKNMSPTLGAVVRHRYRAGNAGDSASRRGFDVTATEVSGAGVHLAKTNAEGQGIKIGNSI